MVLSASNKTTERQYRHLHGSFAAQAAGISAGTGPGPGWRSNGHPTRQYIMKAAPCKESTAARYDYYSTTDITVTSIAVRIAAHIAVHVLYEPIMYRVQHTKMKC